MNQGSACFLSLQRRRASCIQLEIMLNSHISIIMVRMSNTNIFSFLYLYVLPVESDSFHEATFKWLGRNYKCASWSKQSLIYVRSPFPLFLLCFKCCAWFSCAVGTGWRSPCSSLCGCLRWHLTHSATAELAAQTESRERALSHPLPQLRPLHLLPLSSHHHLVNKSKSALLALDLAFF